MENKKATLTDVDITTVTLKQLVEFIDNMRTEFPVAIKVVAKRLLAQEYGVQIDEIPTDHYPFDDDAIIESLKYLKDDMHQQATGEAATRFILSLHSTFGFGKKRVIRLWENASQMFDGNAPSVEDLAKWCERRGLDYDEVFGYQRQVAPAKEVTGIGD